MNVEDTRMQSIIRRIYSKLIDTNNIIKHIFAQCCSKEAGLPAVDFIVDAFDRGDSGDLGPYWGNSSYLGIKDGRGIVQSGNPMGPVTYEGDNFSTESPSSFIFGVPDLYFYDYDVKAQPANAFLCYIAKLSSVDHHVKVGFWLQNYWTNTSPNII